MSDDLAEWLRSQVECEATCAEDDYVEMDEDYEILVPAGKIRDAAEEITRLRAALATARREGMEEAAQMAADFETVFYQRTMPANDPHECAARAAREIAAAIRALKGEGDE